MRRFWLYLVLFFIAAGPGLALAGWAFPILAVRLSGGDYVSIPAGSMGPALLIGDRALVWDIGDEVPPRGSVILFDHPRQGVQYVKRVIGLPGETVRLVGGVVEIDGVPVGMTRIGDRVTPYTRSSRCMERVVTAGEAGCRNELWRETLPDGTTARVINSNDNSMFADNTPLYEVPAGQVFVLGDNRDNSLDSRYDVGFVPLVNVVGIVTRIHFSTGEDGIRWDRFFRRVE